MKKSRVQVYKLGVEILVPAVGGMECKDLTLAHLEESMDKLAENADSGLLGFHISSGRGAKSSFAIPNRVNKQLELPLEAVGEHPDGRQLPAPPKKSGGKRGRKVAPKPRGGLAVV